MRRSLVAIAGLLGLTTGLVVAVDQPKAPAPPTAVAARVLPGMLGGGVVQLPNQWRLRPAGRTVPLGDFPVNLALHPGGEWLAVLHAGYGENEIAVLQLGGRGPRIVSRVTLEDTFCGLCFSPDGRQLYASGGEMEVVHAFDFSEGLLGNHRRLVVAKPTETFIPGGLAIDRGGKTLYVPGTFGQSVAIVPLDAPEKIEKVALADAYPYACLPDTAGKRVFVSLWKKGQVAVLDPGAKKIEATWSTERHPTEMSLSPDGKRLFVACANSTRVSVLDTETGKSLETLNCALYPGAPSGNTPNSLALTPDGQMLFVANADNNDVAVFNVAEPGKARSLGFIPVGWYPTSVRYNAKDHRLYVANGKGTTPLANPQGPNPLLRRRVTTEQYIAGLLHGSLTVLDVPTPARMGEYTKQAFACSPLKEDQGVVGDVPAGNPVPANVGDPSPIKHVIYVIKENRTYDQVLGDMREGNGDPHLCLFPEKITPNHHKLAREFVLLDNFYVDGEVSADGHEWSMGAYATDFVEKVWPQAYRASVHRKFTYPAEGHAQEIARPAAGYIWDRCAEAGLTYRSYGEWVENGKTPKDPGRAMAKALEGHIDPLYRGFDLDYPDQKRVDRFLEELAGFEKQGAMPRFIVLRLPNDHTAGTRVGKKTPTAMVADNDLALGRVVESVSKSSFWKETALFVVEDDAQNGSDHVDAHRTVALVISPYTKRGHVDSTLYSTTSMLRTMELILGLKPMSQFDAAARPMYASFQPEANLKGYQPVKPETDLEAINRADAPGAELSGTFDLTKEDAADDLALNEVIWKSVRGADSVMPAPVRAGFVFPRPKKDDAD